MKIVLIKVVHSTHATRPTRPEITRLMANMMTVTVNDEYAHLKPSDDRSPHPKSYLT